MSFDDIEGKGIVNGIIVKFSDGSKTDKLGGLVREKKRQIMERGAKW